MMEPFEIAVIAGGLLGLASLAVWQRNRHRQVWRAVCRMRVDMEIDLRADRRRIARLAAGGLRLPPDVPSQNGEDLWLWDHFGRKRTGFYVDVGAHDGRRSSNTYFLEALGWTGLLVEPVRPLFEECVKTRPHSRVVHAAATAADDPPVRTFSYVEGDDSLSFLDTNEDHRARVRLAGGVTREVEVPCRTLDTLLADHVGPIDFVSIDVEGGELAVLRGFDLDRFRPAVLVVEQNTPEAGAPIAEWLRARGYAERDRIERNVFYVREGDARP